ncbi:hypothetical protein EDD11_005639 [Mortierella claussenii]|nr:hypothetical protein EDD11_005639 [Mortierella claussenii]
MGKNAFSSIESPTPLTDSDSSGDSDVEGDGHKEGSKYTKAEQMAFERLGYRPRPSQSRGALGRMGGSTSTFRSGVEGPGSTTSFHDNNRTSFDSEPMTPTTSRFMGMDDSSAALPAHQRSRGRTSLDMSDDERRQQQQQQQATEPKKNRASWRPSLSLIRQESSSFNVPTTKQDQKTYPQNDPYRLSDTAMLEEEESKEGATTDAKPTVTDSATGATPTAGRKIKSDEKKKRRRKRRRSERKQQVAAVQAHASRGLPDLADILEKRTRYPLSFDDFEAFLRSHRAVEYLNFWADVTAHEQLCKTFAISERRLKREQQLEERAMARDRRGTYGHLLSPGQTASTGVLEGGSGRRSMERNQLSIYDASNEQESPNHSIRGGSMDVFANLKVPGRRPSASTVEYLGNGIRRATPQQPPARQSPPQFYQRPLSPPSIFGEKAELEETEEEQFMQPISGPCDGKAELDETVEELLSPPMAERFDKAYGEPSTAPWSQVSHRKSVVPNGSSMASVDSHRYDYGQQLRRDESNVNIGGRRSGESAYSPSLYSPTATATGSGAQEGGRALLAQSYRMISLEDVEESAMKIYRKYLIQLRTASMAAEEREADAMALRAAAKAAAIENGEAAFSGDDHTTMSMRGSGGRGSGRDHERVLARGWDGYAEQVIAEWNERWKENRSAETRRARRMAHRHRRGLDGVFEQPESVRHQQLWERGASSTVPTSSRIPPEADLEKGTLPVDEGDRDAALAQVMDRMTGSNDQTSDGKNATGRPRRPKMDRNITSTGITAFLARLLKTETTVVELPNMTINTTTVVTHADRSDGESEYDDDDDDDYYDDDYDSEDLEDQDEDGVVAKSGRSDGLNDTFKLEAPIMSYLRTTRPNSADASLAGDMNVFESNGPSIQLHRMVTMNNEGGQTRGMPLTRPPYLQEPSAGSSNPADDATLIRAIAASDEKRSDTPALEHVQSIADLSTIAAQSAEAAAFYLPLECRQRIHTQMQQQQQREQDTLGRLTLRNSNSDGSPQMFGGAKTFVVDVVLRDHYFPLFLQQVKDQNLGLLHQNHINNRIKQRGILVMGLLLWTLVLAGQVVLMLMGMGGWRKPWVWVVGLVGGFLGCLCLWTGQTGFSPLLGLLGKMSEDQRVFRLRPIKEYSIRSRHWRQAVWIVVGCLFWSGVAAAIFAILPQDI